MDSSICQACRQQPITIAVESDEPTQPYLLCAMCAHRLEALALRPLEWFNLAAIHSPWKFLLHDDFYDEGSAHWPREPIETPELFPAPSLSEIAEDLERLIDYAMTRHFFLDVTADAIARALGNHAGIAVLGVLQSRVAATQNPHIIGRAYEISACVLGRVAEDWIRRQWQDPGPLMDLARASALCLPAEEGLTYTMNALDAMSLKERIELCQALDWFQSPRALD